MRLPRLGPQGSLESAVPRAQPWILLTTRPAGSPCCSSGLILCQLPARARGCGSPSSQEGPLGLGTPRTLTPHSGALGHCPHPASPPCNRGTPERWAGLLRPDRKSRKGRGPGASLLETQDPVTLGPKGWCGRGAQPTQSLQGQKGKKGTPPNPPCPLPSLPRTKHREHQMRRLRRQRS